MTHTSTSLVCASLLKRGAMRAISHTALRALLVLCLLAGPLMSAPLPAAAAGLVVNSTADTGAADCTTTCTLRDAIALAQPGDEITFDLPDPSTITLTQGEIVIDKDLTISGPGMSSLAIDGNHAGRIFKAASGWVEISGLTLQNGLSSGAPGGTAPGVNGAGGALWIAPAGVVTLQQVRLYANQAAGGPGGAPAFDGAPAGSGGGAGGAGGDCIDAAQPGAFGGGGGGGSFCKVKPGAAGGFGGGGGGGGGYGGAGGSGGTHGGAGEPASSNGYGGGGGGAGMGGAVFIDGAPTQVGLLVVGEGVVFEANSAIGGSGGNGSANGGGGGGGGGLGSAIFNNGALNLGADVTFTNNTLTAGSGGLHGEWGSGAGQPGQAVDTTAGVYDNTGLSGNPTFIEMDPFSVAYSPNAQTVVLSAQVSSPLGPADGGSLTFSLNDSLDQPLGSPVSAPVQNGLATADYSLPAGAPRSQYTLTAVYSGPQLPAAGGAGFTITGKPSQVTAASASAPFSRLPQAVRLSAAVQNSAGQAVTSGQVLFTLFDANHAAVGAAQSAELDAAGQASLIFILTGGSPEGAYTLEAAFAGSAEYEPSSTQAEFLVTPGQSQTTTLEVTGPPGSMFFGYFVKALPNGNLVVVDPAFSMQSVLYVGAVFLMDGDTLQIIDIMTGSQTQDMLGFGGITVLDDGSFLVHSPYWDNETAPDAGAVTWCSAETGCPDQVSPDNSLVGSSEDDQVGVTDTGSGLTPLPGGAFVVASPQWDAPAAEDAGAVTYCQTASACFGPVSLSNSLSGPAESYVGDNHPVVVLAGGEFVVRTPYWYESPSGDEKGAVTLCRPAGANGSCAGQMVSAANSLTGAGRYDWIGDMIVALSGGGFVVGSSDWSNPDPAGTIYSAGAVTLCAPDDGAGFGSCAGQVVSTANSLTGAFDYDYLGASIIPLANGDYLVAAPEADILDANGTEMDDAGLVTYCGADGSCTGQTATPANSLSGSHTYDWVGETIAGLPNGAYVVAGSSWNSDLGAVTFCPTAASCTGVPVSAANSLTGTNTADEVGSQGIAVLADGSFVVASPYWSSGGLIDAGAVTWCSPVTGCPAQISAANSLTGAAEEDGVGSYGVYALAAGGFVVASEEWQDERGAVTTCPTPADCMGQTVSIANSLVGAEPGDYMGVTNPGLFALDWGGYVLPSMYWDDGQGDTMGAISLCRARGCIGLVSENNSLTGRMDDSGIYLAYDYDAVHARLAAAFPTENRVMLFSLPRAGVQVELSANAAEVKHGQSLTLTARVTSPDGLPGGEVTFADSDSVLGTVALDAQGKATLQVSADSIHAGSISAAYAGDGNFLPGVSRELTFTTQQQIFMPLVRR